MPYTFNVFTGTFDYYESSSGGINFADDETPSGTVNGVNTTFTLANTPSPATSLQLYRDGQLLTPGGVDYTLATATITMVYPPATNTVLTCWYRY